MESFSSSTKVSGREDANYLGIEKRDWLTRYAIRTDNSYNFHDRIIISELGTLKVKIIHNGSSDTQGKTET